MKYWQHVIKIPFIYVFGVLVLLQFSSLDRAKAQKFSFVDSRKKEAMNFDLIKNLIIIPVSINGKGPFNFILDTGVGSLIITDPSLIDTLKLKKLRSTKIYGLGEGVQSEAYMSNEIDVAIKGARIERIPTAILKEDIFDLSSYLGVKIYGLVGYQFFDSFLVKINYINKRLSYSLNSKLERKTGQRFPIVIENNRPYIFADMQLADTTNAKVKLIIDCGASHALSMDALDGKAFPTPKQSIAANLGVGLSGIISGSVGRIPRLAFGKYVFSNVVSGFPVYEAIASKVGLREQNGNLGAEILKRFNIIFDYQNLSIYLKPNLNFKKPFEHDMAGIEFFAHPESKNNVFISRIEPNSPAEKAGFLVKDEIVSVNLKYVEKYTLEELSELFKSEDGKTLLIEIIRNEKNIIKLLKLKRRI